MKPKRKRISSPKPVPVSHLKAFKEYGFTGLKSDTVTFVGIPQLNDKK